jgi:3-hydroxyacyl-[acyl-carrier-protein] dehydratase
MRFQLVDRIDAVEVGKSLRAVKHLTLAEEYLADHFPSFPVMPGVLQLQTLVEAGAWLMRVTDGFAKSVWTVREVRGVKFGTFVAPGHCLVVNAELTKWDGSLATIKGRGEVDGQQTIAAQVTMAGYSLAERQQNWAERDARLIRHWRDQWELLSSGRRWPPN